MHLTHPGQVAGCADPKQVLSTRLTCVVSCQLPRDHLSLMIPCIRSLAPGNGLLSTLCRIRGCRAMMASHLLPPVLAEP